MPDTTLLFQLQNATFNSLSNMDFKLATIDMDDANLNKTQIDYLKSQDKILFTYISIGEAEDYREYWSDGDWNNNLPDFVLSENSQWEGNYPVKFWDSEWQDIMVERVKEAAELGYEGLNLDIVDGYQIPEVKNAYNGDDIAQEMIQFIMKLAEAARSVPGAENFRVIPQNAVELLENREYLEIIDGIGVEDLWYSDNENSSWTNGDLEYIKNATDAGKFVLATSYPTQNAKQETFVENALNKGFIPFVGNRALNGQIDDINSGIWERIQEKGITIPESTGDGSGDSGSTDDGTGDSGSTGDGTGGSGSTDDGTGDSGSTWDGTGGSGSTDDGTGDSGVNGRRTGDPGSTGDGTGGSGSTDDGTGDLGSTDDGTGDSGSTGDGTGGSGSTDDGTGDSGSTVDGTGVLEVDG